MISVFFVDKWWTFTMTCLTLCGTSSCGFRAYNGPQTSVKLRHVYAYNYDRKRNSLWKGKARQARPYLRKGYRMNPPEMLGNFSSLHIRQILKNKTQHLHCVACKRYCHDMRFVSCKPVNASIYVCVRTALPQTPSSIWGGKGRKERERKGKGWRGEGRWGEGGEGKGGTPNQKSWLRPWRQGKDARSINTALLRVTVTICSTLLQANVFSSLLW